MTKNWPAWYDQWRSKGWTAQKGFFWLYFNTTRGTRKTDPRKKFMQEHPWVVRQFDSRMRWLLEYPAVGYFEDHFAREVRSPPAGQSLGIASLETVYSEKPSYRNQRSSIQHVKGYLRVEGVLMWR